MNNIQIFNNPTFGEIRTVILNGQPWFVGRDIAKALGYARPDNAVTTHCKHSLKQGVPSLQSSDKEVEATVIPEGDMYRLISKSKLKSAEQFEEWVFDEVLPTIRKTGSYNQPQLPQTTMELLELHYKALKEVDSKVETISAEVGSVREDLESLKMDLPILPIEAEKITNATRAKGVSVMGGKNSNAYANRSIVNAVYKDIYGQIYRNFWVSTYKAIKRSQTDKVLNIIEEYKPPVVLQDRIDNENAQQKLNV